MRWIALLPACLCGCATLFLQEDNFRRRIPAECVDEQACAQLFEEARRRRAACAENAIGKVRCDEATADLERLGELLGRARAKREAAEAQAQKATRDTEELEAERRRYRAQRDVELAYKQKQEAEEAARQAADLARRAEMQRVCEVDAWQRRESRKCRESWSTDGCKEPPAVANEAEVERCRGMCRGGANSAYAEAYNEALASCVRVYMVAEGKGDFACSFAPPASADDVYKTGPTVCADDCKATGKRAWEARQKELAEERKHVKCCDGTRSPSCLYGQPLRGCCSHHRGVCGG